jgi:hypothetical protein
MTPSRGAPPARAAASAGEAPPDTARAGPAPVEPSPPDGAVRPARARRGARRRPSGVRLFVGEVARLTGLEPATPGVTGRYSNRLSYNRAWGGFYG